MSAVSGVITPETADISAATSSSPAFQTSSPAVSIMSAGPTAWREAGAVRLLTWPALAAAGVDAAVTARSGGVSSGPYDSLNPFLRVVGAADRLYFLAA